MAGEGMEVKIARLRVGLKQYELAAEIGINATALSEMESGRRTISPEIARKIALVLEKYQKEA